MAKDFAKTLGCSYSSRDKCFKNPGGSVFITNCVGHLFSLDEPFSYDPKFRSWKNLPVIPDKFNYHVNEKLKDAAKTVIKLLKTFKKDEILIATDADREGEIIARECLNEASIKDYSKIKRFWVSQALTPDVIHEGIKNAKPLSSFNDLAQEGFSRQHADWLVGINGTRFISNKASSFFTVGRVQTSVLSEINERCKKIDSFVSSKYYEVEGEFCLPDGKKITSLYFDGKTTRFESADTADSLYNLTKEKVSVSEIEREERVINPPLLYNLNDLQKDAFHFFSYSALETSSILQTLYEKHKCISYPRTPSKVMGKGNVELCRNLYERFLKSNFEYLPLKPYVEISEDCIRIFNDSKLESHHAIIPLDDLPEICSEEEKNIYSLVLERFMISFAPLCRVENQKVFLKTGSSLFFVKGQRTICEGWKKFRRFTRLFRDEDENSQELSGIDWETLTLSGIKTVSKKTKPLKHYNEASILAFMENPKGEGDGEKLTGLGTPSTRHTFIPKLLESGYIFLEGKNILITEKGKTLLKMIGDTPFYQLSDISETTRWEEKLSKNPEAFEKDIRAFVGKLST